MKERASPPFFSGNSSGNFEMFLTLYSLMRTLFQKVRGVDGYANAIASDENVG